MTQGKHLVGPVSERDHSQGPATAAVTLVQYGDYECPYTRQSTTIVRAIQQQLGDKFTLCLSQLPAHRNPSPRAARGFRCRGRRSSGQVLADA